MKRRHVKMTKKHRKHLSNTAHRTRAANITKTMSRGGYHL